MRKPRYVYECPDCGVREDPLRLFVLGGKVREPFRDRDGRDVPGVEVRRILCWWCREYHDPAEVEACMAIPRPVAATGNGSTSSLTAKIPQWLSQFPELWEFLSKNSYADGAPRQTGKISLSLQSGGVQVTLTDPTSSTYCSRLYPSIEDALLELEIGLKESRLQWRPSGPLKPARRPKGT